jgi:hypothetical protein
MKDKLTHLIQEEPVLMKYKQLFQVEGTNNFQGSDLVEHHIATDDAKPIRKPLYRVPFYLRKEMETQVQDMLDKRII